MFADDNFKFHDNGGKFSNKVVKTLWEKEKLLVTSNFPFSHSVFKRLLLQTRKKKGLFGKGLIPVCLHLVSVGSYIVFKRKFSCLTLLRLIFFPHQSNCTFSYPRINASINIKSFKLTNVLLKNNHH